MDARFLFPIADMLQIQLTVEVAGHISGSIRRHMVDGSFILGFPMEVASGYVSWGRQVALLVRGPGDLVLCAEYEAEPKSMQVRIIDRSLLKGVKLSRLFEESAVASLDDCRALVSGGVVATFVRGADDTWQKVIKC